jgi:exodeoxyribonuclease V alpha subunit
LAGALEDAGIEGPADVTAANLALLPKVGPTRAGRLFSSFLAAAPVYEVVEMLVPAGVEVRVAARVVDALGPPAPRLLRDDPWRLLGLAGVTLGDADRLARVAIPGVQRDDLRRSRALVGFVLARQARDGHTLTPRAVVIDGLREFETGSADDAIAAAVDAAIVVDVDEDLLALTRYAEAEDGVAQGIARLIATASPIRAGKPAKGLDAAQQSAVSAALRDGVCVLTGGPGTGKSRTVATLVALAEQAGKSVALAAPTGRAAKRCPRCRGSPRPRGRGPARVAARHGAVTRCRLAHRGATRRG